MVFSRDGSRPVKSSDTRRKKVESVLISDGGIPTALSFLKTCVST